MAMISFFRIPIILAVLLFILLFMSNCLRWNGKEDLSTITNIIMTITFVALIITILLSFQSYVKDDIQNHKNEVIATHNVVEDDCISMGGGISFRIYCYEEVDGKDRLVEKPDYRKIDNTYYKPKE